MTRVLARSRLLALLACAVALLLVSSHLQVWRAVSPTLERGSDFAATYIAADMWRHGDAGHLYDRQAQIQAHRRIGAAGYQLDNPFVNPPPAAVLAAPYSLLDPGIAYRAWTLTQLLLLLAAAAMVAWSAPWPAWLPKAVAWAAAGVAVAGAGAAIAFLQGQWDAVTMIGLAGAYACWRRGRPATGAALLVAAAAVSKPHLVLGLAAWMLGRRDRRMLAGAGAGLAAVVIASVALAGPAATVAFVRAPTLSSAVSPVRMLLGFNGLLASWLGDNALTYTIAGVLSLAALGVAARLGAVSRRGPRLLEASLAGALALSLVASPHLLAQDLALMGLPLIWCLARASEADGAAGGWPGRRSAGLLVGWIALDVTVRTDVLNTTPAPPGRLVPWVLIGAALGAALACGPAGYRRARLATPAIAQNTAPGR